MNISKTFEFTLPTWVICPIVNSDSSGISNEDDSKLNVFLSNLTDDEGAGTWEFPEDIDSAKYFAYSNDIYNTGDDVILAQYHVFN